MRVLDKHLHLNPHHTVLIRVIVVKNASSDRKRIKHREKNPPKNEDAMIHLQRNGRRLTNVGSFTHLDKHFCQVSQLFLYFYNKSRKGKKKKKVFDLNGIK